MNKVGNRTTNISRGKGLSIPFSYVFSLAKHEYTPRENRTPVSTLQELRASHCTIGAHCNMLFHKTNSQFLRESNPFCLREGQKYYLYTKEPWVHI